MWLGKKLLFIYTIRHSAKAKRIRLTVDKRGKVEVVLPRRVPRVVGETLVRKQSGWVLGKLARLEAKQACLPSDLRDYSPKHYLEHRGRAKRIIKKRVRELAEEHGFNLNKITIRNQKTKWGSCSQKGNLNFHYKLIFLDSEVRDYVIIHELCHLRVMNHSSHFWREVENILPNYKEQKRALQAI